MSDLKREPKPGDVIYIDTELSVWDEAHGVPETAV